MTLPALLAHVAARWAVTRTPAHGWVPDESEIEMTETERRPCTLKDLARAWGGQPAPERTYTLADMARAWREGAESEWHTNRHGETGDGYPGDPNPYEQEEA